MKTGRIFNRFVEAKNANPDTIKTGRVFNRFVEAKIADR